MEVVDSFVVFTSANSKIGSVSFKIGFWSNSSPLSLNSEGSLSSLEHILPQFVLRKFLRKIDLFNIHYLLDDVSYLNGNVLGCIGKF